MSIHIHEIVTIYDLPYIQFKPLQNALFGGLNPSHTF